MLTMGARLLEVRRHIYAVLLLFTRCATKNTNQNLSIYKIQKESEKCKKLNMQGHSPRFRYPSY